MQIQPSFSAAQAASIASQATSKDPASSGAVAPTSPTSTSEAHVEQSGGSNSDRDAQGQGDGMPGHSDPNQDENDIASPPETREHNAAPQLPGEPPSQLDIVG